MAEAFAAESALVAVTHDLVLASRILVQHAVLDSFGHVSARHPGDPQHFLMPMRKPPSLVSAEDILEFAFDGSPAAADDRPLFIERFIHSEIYAARPDVQAVVHSHARGAVTFSVVSAEPLRAICHTCGFLGTGVPRFEIRDHAGEASDLLIRTSQLGRSLADCLGEHAVVLMRGHGSTAVGASIPQAVYRAIYTEINAAIQAGACQLGDVTFLTDGEAAASDATAPLQAERCWAAWTKDAGPTDGS